jgi:hypothetical protein
MLMVFAIMPLHFFGLLGMSLLHLQAITLVYMLMAAVSLVLLAFGALSLIQAANMLFIVTQTPSMRRALPCRILQATTAALLETTR